MHSISAIVLREWLHDGDEIAVVDVSEGGPFSVGHILVASNAPPAQFETLLPVLVPRRTVRVVVTNGQGENLERVARDLSEAGYSNVSILDGGNTAWSAAGFRLFAGSNIVSKAFGELVEEKCGTPHIEADELFSWMTEKRDFYLFDSRPLAEYRTVSLPGATDCPGAELVYRVSEVVTDPNRPIVVNCAGRTRSIIGAQSLRDAGFENPVFALKNGTMGWQIAGLSVEKGNSNMVPEPSTEGVHRAVRRADDVVARDGLTRVTYEQVRQWRDESSRTTYVLDVRQPDVFERGHIPGSVNSPGGQLVQATDMFVAVRHARLVLVDDHEVQAVMTAHWLNRMGWDVSVLADAQNHMTETGMGEVIPLRPVHGSIVSMSTDELKDLYDAGECDVIDVGESYWYRQGRIPGSWYSKRAALPDTLRRFDANRMLVFVCTHGATSPHAAGDALRLGFLNVRVLDGGRSAWRREGHTVEVIDMDDDEFILSDTDDMWYPPWSRKEGVREAMLEYLTWEVGLLGLVEEETYLSFRL